ncbi:NADH-quinone oxidoreductase subunit NuoE [Actinoplanes sp. NPDC051859]|uniref:NADH-quinone oxidoreductase subunit NuoE n=1 Tax=Actinoplanes sp. NPDC051859 TaxID=3363909 RepID=UPI00378DC50B
MSDTKVDFSPAAAPLAEKLLDSAREIIARYPLGRERSALLPLLHLVQTTEGHVSPDGVAFCAEVLGINKAQVGAVATFYTMYKRRPTGEYLVSVCTNTLCNMLGGQEIYDGLTEHLGVGHDETTADGKITLEHAECLAACDYAPVVTVNYDFTIDQATPDSAVGLVEGLRKGEKLTPSRGARLCSLKEMQFQLAGFADERDGAVADGPAGAPTLRGVTLAQQHGVAVPNFDIDTPIATTKPARDESARAVKDPGPGSATAPATAKPEGKIASVAKKAAEAVKHAAAVVVDKAETVVEHRKAGEPVKAGDDKDPEVRTAEHRNPDASTPTPDEGKLRTGQAPENAAEAAGAAGNAPAGDGKPAGDGRPAGDSKRDGGKRDGGKRGKEKK